MIFNPISLLAHAYSFRKWSAIARQHDLILSQNSNGRFRCFDIDDDVLISSGPTAREAVQNALIVESLGR